MFKAKDVKTNNIVKVYAVEGNKFLVEDGNAFTWTDKSGYTLIDGAALACDCTLTKASVTSFTLPDLIAGIVSGKIEMSIGDSFTTRMKSGMEVDFVLTDIDDKAYRFESRDCLGRYDPITRIDKFYHDVWTDLPDELRDSIIGTERPYKDSADELHTLTQKLFLPSASEIFPPDECYGDKDVYAQMEWYKGVHNRVRAFKKGAGSDWYWTQSAYSGNSTYWCSVDNNGSANYYNASSTYIAAPVCFRIPHCPNPRP